MKIFAPSLLVVGLKKKKTETGAYHLIGDRIPLANSQLSGAYE